LIYEINYGKRCFSIDVIQENRRQLSITVHPDLRITAKIPPNLDSDIIKHRLNKRARWIARQFDFFEQYHPPQLERRYVSGETHYYLGRQYRLRIVSGKKSRVCLKGRFFIVELPDFNNHQKVKNLMQKWYNQHAKNLSGKRLLMYLPTFTKLGAAKPVVLYRRMQKRWGSCTGQQKIVLNTELVKVPVHCIDYVIIHELCHLLFPKHDSRFFRLLNRLVPDWKNRKERLEKSVL
jgi:predicted metal-dependent hydrolase